MDQSPLVKYTEAECRDLLSRTKRCELIDKVLANPQTPRDHLKGLADAFRRENKRKR